ncbi:GNAT family protein [Devosia sp.]|uniref:GNAT family N-acetyltransferase n=1 Tax=Devosia sp. TaxID=1871048 RepID=UPI0025BE0F55|nr:GNAT family protein [Devosia sp.]
MTAHIRPAALSDAEGYNRALDIVARERQYLRLVEAPPIPSSRAFVAGNIENGNPHYVALVDDEVVGWCDICRDGSIGSGHVGSLGMGIVASHRGRGIGRALIEAALAEASETFRRVELDVYASNIPAIALYEKVGFAHEGRRIDAIHINGAYQDILMMGLLFVPSTPELRG